MLSRNWLQDRDIGVPDDEWFTGDPVIVDT